MTLLGRFFYQNKFQQNNTRFAAGSTYRILGRTWLRGEFAWAPSSNTVIANQDYTVELTQGLRSGVAAGVEYRFLRFQSADNQVIGAFLNIDPHSNLHLYLRYTPAFTRFHLPPAGVWNQGGLGRLVWDAHGSFSPFFFFAVGAENFSALAAEKLGRFAAQTYGGGMELRLKRKQGLSYFFGF